VHGNLGTEGALKALRDITTGLKWKPVVEPLSLTGAPDSAAQQQCWELGATVAASLM
jgi:hypothetical protein